MKETTYHFSLNYNINNSGNEIIETRAIKRRYVDDASSLLEILKAEVNTYSVKEVDKRIEELLGTDSFIELSDEITSDQFEKYMDESCDLFSVDMNMLHLH